MVQLRKGNDWYVKFFCQFFEGMGDGIDFLFLVVVLIVFVVIYQLQVVDYNQVDVVLYFQVVVFGLEFEDVDVWCVVNVDGDFIYLFQGCIELFLFVVF